MGLLDIFRRDKAAVDAASAPAAPGDATPAAQASTPPGSTDADKLVAKLVDIGIDGAGPFDSARTVAERALSRCHGDAQAAAKQVVADHSRVGAAGGFVTGVGGLLTMIVALPANVVEFYLVSTRMVAAVAHLRGYDLDKPETRSAVLLSLVGADADEVLRRAGVVTGAGRLSSVAVASLPASVRMMINKGVGFRLASRFGGKAFAKLGKAVPVVGGAVGAGLDWYMVRKIGKQALHDFPQR